MELFDVKGVVCHCRFRTGWKRNFVRNWFVRYNIPYKPRRQYQITFSRLRNPCKKTREFFEHLYRVQTWKRWPIFLKFQSSSTLSIRTVDRQELNSVCQQSSCKGNLSVVFLRLFQTACLTPMQFHSNGVILWACTFRFFY